jgi:hypothetical protein
MEKITLSRKIVNEIIKKTGITEAQYIEFIKKIFNVREEDIEWIE